MIDTNYYHYLLTQISVRESAVDCSRCDLDLKCCTYRPFIANFLVGGFAHADFFNEELKNEWDFLIVGLSPNMKYRKYFSKKGKWGFGTDATLLCSFYNKSTGGCRIWNSRAAVCRTFFCKSSYQETGAYYWKKAEEFTWQLEWALLEDFLHHKGWTLEEVAQIKKYLEEEGKIATEALPPEFLLKDVAEAQRFYSEARAYVQALKEDQVLELLGQKGRDVYNELLAQKQTLGIGSKP